MDAFLETFIDIRPLTSITHAGKDEIARASKSSWPIRWPSIMAFKAVTQLDIPNKMKKNI
jgi:hypothetical protein